MKSIDKSENLGNESGFSLVEMLISMALLSLIMMISINIVSIVGKTAQTVDYQVNVTQETSYAAERVRRVVRSADDIVFGSDSIIVRAQDRDIAFSIELIGEDQYLLLEDEQSVMSSDVILTKAEGTDLFTEIYDDESELIGVRMTFWAFDKNDDTRRAGALVSTQAVNRSLILNK